MAREWVEKFARSHFKDETYQKLAERILYYRMDFTDEKEYGDWIVSIKNGGRKSHILFCRCPQIFQHNRKWFKNVAGAEHGKVVLEKPFGEDFILGG